MVADKVPGGRVVTPNYERRSMYGEQPINDSNDVSETAAKQGGSAVVYRVRETVRVGVVIHGKEASLAMTLDGAESYANQILDLARKLRG